MDEPAGMPGTTLREIMESVRRVTELLAELAAAARANHAVEEVSHPANSPEP